VFSLKQGRVVRCAAKKFHPQHSKPQSAKYTTRKIQQESIQVDKDGVIGDYNHYRSTVLKSTINRAVSILTTDSMKLVTSRYKQARDGDLGENLLIDGLAFSNLAPTQRYQVGSSVVLEITEPMEPCANLCKLPYINDSNLLPKQRIANCQALLDLLGTHDGLRGWYAKVIQPGRIHQHCTVVKLER